MNTSEKIEQILSSLQGVSRAEAPPFLYTRIEVKLEHRDGGATFSVLSPVQVVLATLGVAVLLFVNVYLCTSLRKPAIQPNQGETWSTIQYDFYQ